LGFDTVLFGRFAGESSELRRKLPTDGRLALIFNSEIDMKYRNTGTIFGCLLLVCNSQACRVAFGDHSAATPERPPNVLMIVIDDQNDWIGCLHGHPQAKTPHIDSLANQGTIFLNAHCQSPLCNPSRTSVMTGLRPSSTGVYGLSPGLRAVDDLRLTTTLPQHFRRHGYQTLMAGKIYHGTYGRKPADDEFGIVGPPSAVGPKPSAPLVQTPSRHPLVDWGTFPHHDEDKGDWKLASWTVDQLQQPHDKPFFMSVGFFLPHVPCYVTQKWFDLFPENALQLPPVLDDDRSDTPRFSWNLHWKLPEPRLKFLHEATQWKNLVRSYLASTAFVDSQVGRIMEALNDSPFADNTIVVLWSDHGWHLGEKAITGKNTLWERSTRVPLIFAGPKIAPNAACEQPAELLDIYPTLSELCALPTQDHLEGHSLVPQLTNAAAAREWPAITTHNHDNHGIRSSDWRYIRYADGSEELYNLRDDPNEWKNLALDANLVSTLEAHRKWLPVINRMPVPGSEHRILLYDAATGRANWEGEDILPGSPIPEVED
jgi:choline-sulfatase